MGSPLDVAFASSSSAMQKGQKTHEMYSEFKKRRLFLSSKLFLYWEYAKVVFVLASSINSVHVTKCFNLGDQDWRHTILNFHHSSDFTQYCVLKEYLLLERIVTVSFITLWLCGNMVHDTNKRKFKIFYRICPVTYLLLRRHFYNSSMHPIATLYSYI